MHTTKRPSRRKPEDKAVPDLTPMIDVTFQLLIFFILCTRFRVNEDNMRVDLPKDQGPRSDIVPPKEQLTIYCVWDDASKTNRYVVAIDARGRKPVENGYAKLNDIVIFPSDNNATIGEKKARYGLIHKSLVDAIESYITSSGARIEKIEISFAKDATVGVSSGTAPWMFVSTAVDAATSVNQHRENASLEPLGLTFKFSDALGAYR